MKFLGHHRMQQLVDWGEVAPQGNMMNQRQANCKVCGSLLHKGQGFRWIWFWYDGDERATHIFFCGMCNAYWLTYIGYPDQDILLIDQYKIAFNIKRKDELCLAN